MIAFVTIVLINALICNVHNFDTDLCIDKVKGAIKLFDIVCEDRNYGEYYGNIVELYLFLSYVQWMRGYHDDAFVSLDEAYEYAKEYESLCADAEQHYTAMLLKNVKYRIGEIPCGLRTEDLPERWPVWGPVYSGTDEIKSDPRWDQWAEKCRK
ncbi:MAG: hypothetical protein PUE85_01180 [Firmicutes bacterium]|nr:hypothetical protein [Bacillota bacterium]